MDTVIPLLDEIRLQLAETMADRSPDFIRASWKPEHGRLARRAVRASTETNDYVKFPGIGQVLAVRWQITEITTGEKRVENVCGVTSLSPDAAALKRLPELNRGRWRIGATHHIPDRSFDENQSRFCTGRGPANTTLFLRIAIGLMKLRGDDPRHGQEAEASARPARDDREHAAAHNRCPREPASAQSPPSGMHRCNQVPARCPRDRQAMNPSSKFPIRLSRTTGRTP